MILIVIIAISIFQIGIYFLLDLRLKKNLKNFCFAINLAFVFLFSASTILSKNEFKWVELRNADPWDNFGVLDFWFFDFHSYPFSLYFFFKQVWKDFVIKKT
jgi:hypothetical protein